MVPLVNSYLKKKKKHTKSLLFLTDYITEWAAELCLLYAFLLLFDSCVRLGKQRPFIHPFSQPAGYLWLQPAR